MAAPEEPAGRFARTPSFLAIYERYGASVRALAERLVADRAEAENIAQETFMALWRELSSLEGDPGSMWGWLERTTRNFAGMHRRKHTRVTVIDDGGLVGLHEHLQRRTGLVGRIALSDEELRQRVQALPDDQRRVIELRYDEDLSFAQIAERLEHRDADAARLVHFRALKALRRGLPRPAAEYAEFVAMRALAWPVRRARPGGFSPLRREA